MNNEELANVLIESFMGIWPSMPATMKPEVIDLYKVQLIRGLIESGLDNLESVKLGCVKARTLGGQYPPSVPEFIKWCKPDTVKRPEYKLLTCENLPESTPEQIAEAHKLLSKIKESL